MQHFTCPVCSEKLETVERSLRCSAGHNFDLARQGYVNLLGGGGTRHAHGDDKLMVAARTAFLSGGHYNVLVEALCRTAVEITDNSVHLLDVGCGEGFYTCRVAEALRGALKRVDVSGIDISREALIAFSRRDKTANLAVARIASLPLADESCDLVFNLFAPQSDSEFLRVTKRGGHLVCVFPLEEHLMGLKKAIYEKTYENPAPAYAPEGFRLVKKEEVRKTLILERSEDIQNLFSMTPYYYKTGREDQEKARGLTYLETPIAFGIFVYEKE